MGPTGNNVSGITNYLYTYDTTNQLIAVGSAVSFNTNGPIIGSALTHVAGTTNIIINTIGTYVGVTIHVHQLKAFYYPQVQKNVILS
ncbi:triple helix repeat-containing collagen [Bacillus thuringiensis Sbt003]|uniref:Triple helix repeat-containing collagen n=2 Tax=Bacillus cereus group TaxID=86661 RepID=A0A9X0FDG3_BACTU|nr:triple helix repeat-containing collagen [Bacillus thuringiensis Sbt003]